MIKHRLVSLLNSGVTPIHEPNQIPSAFSVSIQNVNDKGYVYIGNDGLSLNSYGFKLYPGQAFAIELPASSHASLFVLGTEQNMKVAVIEVHRAI